MTAAAGTAPQRPDVGAIAERIVRLLNEVEAGVRPARQLCPMFAVHLRGTIRRIRPRPGPVPELHRLVITSTAAGAYEIVAICQRAGRFQAIGLRLSRAGDSWMVTDLARPPVAAGGRGATPLQPNDAGLRTGARSSTVQPAGSPRAAGP